MSVAFIIIMAAAGAAAGGFTYWWRTVSQRSNLWGVSVAPDGSVYGGGYSYTANMAYVAKHDTFGNRIWANGPSVGFQEDRTGFKRVFAASNTEIYGLLYFGATNPGPFDSLMLLKYNGTGAVTWQYGFGVVAGGSSLAGYATGPFSINTTNTALCVTTPGGVGGVANFTVYNIASSGLLNWARVVTMTAGATELIAQNSCFDSTGALIIVGAETPASGNRVGIIVKYSSAGGIQWKIAVSATSSGAGSLVFSSVCVDASDNIFVTGYDASTSMMCAVVLKYNSAGVYQASTGFTGVTGRGALGYTQASTMTFANGNVNLGISNSATPTGYILVIAPSTLALSANSRYVNKWVTGLCYDAGGLVYASGSMGTESGSYQEFMMKAPASGAGTGTWGALTYGAASPLIVSPTYTTATSTVTEAASAATLIATSYTISAVTTTPTITQIVYP